MVFSMVSLCHRFTSYVWKFAENGVSKNLVAGVVISESENIVNNNKKNRKWNEMNGTERMGQRK